MNFDISVKGLNTRGQLTENNEYSENLLQLANCIRFLAIDAVQKANSGHPGMPMGMADIVTILFKDHLKYDPDDPKWFDRDRFIISNVMARCFFMLAYF